MKTEDWFSLLFLWFYAVWNWLSIYMKSSNRYVNQNVRFCFYSQNVCEYLKEISFLPYVTIRISGIVFTGDAFHLTLVLYINKTSHNGKSRPKSAGLRQQFRLVMRARLQILSQITGRGRLNYRTSTAYPCGLLI